MSDSEETTHIVLDIERIIVEVEKRPALYKKELKEYSDRIAKEKWTEVCANVIPKWHELSGAKRKVRGKEVQKKWKNLKDCFARELAAQKKIKSGEPTKKHRKYIYFDALLFLLPHQQPRPTSGNVGPPGDKEELLDHNKGPRNDDGELSNDHGGPRNNNEETPRSLPSAKPAQRTPRSLSSKSSHQISTYEASLLEILKNKQTEEVLEDKNFALMVIPVLAKLNDQQKHFAKIEILNVMRNVKFYTQPGP
ncbi:uncharacterized protein LOC126734683 [Anthonomus grandis grandis]|uniref:uncharacterized protein LOC126734683 n=1 Tax=Anthonomus grandis grandis TaxID=2921223 RepID=UPI0021657784|nr:uncharacterized protein LOC126734683 [Anthonomus grandis grandis]